MKPASLVAGAFFSLGLLCAQYASAEVSSQEKALASRLYDDATKLMGADQAAAACPKYAESQRLDPQLGTLLHLGECYAKLGKTASAWSAFKEAADIAAQRNDKRAQKIRERLASLEKSLSNLVIVVGDSEPAMLELRQDGALVGKAGWGTPIPADPGEHRVTATAPGAKPRELVVAVPSDGQTVTVRLPPIEMLPATSASSEPGGEAKGSDVSQPRAETKADSRSWFSTHHKLSAGVLGGVGLAGIGVGTAFGLMAKPTYDKSASHCNGDHCDAIGHDYRASALQKALISDIAFGVGGAALIGGAVLWFTAPKESAEQPRAAVVPIVGPSGAMISVQRSF